MPDLSPPHPLVLTCRLFGTRPVSSTLENTCHTEGDKTISFLQLGGASASPPSFHQPHSPPSCWIPGELSPYPQPPNFQGFLHSKTSPDHEIMPLSQCPHGRRWETSLFYRTKTAVCPPHLFCCRGGVQNPQNPVVSNEGMSQDPPARSLLSETRNDPAAAPSSTETPASVWRQGSAEQVFACYSHRLILPPKRHNLRIPHGPLPPQKIHLLPPFSISKAEARQDAGAVIPLGWRCSSFSASSCLSHGAKSSMCCPKLVPSPSAQTYCIHHYPWSHTGPGICLVSPLGPVQGG